MRVRLSSGRITLVTAPLDLRCGFPRLSAICQNLLGINLLLGRDIVIFISKNRQFVKIVGVEKWTVNGMAVDKNRKSNFYPLSLAWLFSDFGFFNVETHKNFYTSLAVS